MNSQHPFTPEQREEIEAILAEREVQLERLEAMKRVRMASYGQSNGQNQRQYRTSHSLTDTCRCDDPVQKLMAEDEGRPQSDPDFTPPEQDESEQLDEVLQESTYRSPA